MCCVVFFVAMIESVHSSSGKEVDRYLMLCSVYIEESLLSTFRYFKANETVKVLSWNAVSGIKL